MEDQLLMQNTWILPIGADWFCAAKHLKKRLNPPEHIWEKRSSRVPAQWDASGSPAAQGRTKGLNLLCDTGFPLGSHKRRRTATLNFSFVDLLPLFKCLTADTMIP